jgi:hypothetical protein
VHTAFGSPKYVDPAAFQASVSQQFEAAAAEGRLLGPITDGYRVAYSSRKFSIAVVYDESDGRVETYVDARIGSRHPHASLSCLYVEARLGPAQRIRQIARTRHSLERALGTQAAGLHELLPLLMGPGRDSLLASCVGR